MHKETLGIILLTISAALLLAFNVALQQPASASATLKERDFQLVTGRLQDGGEALYVTDVTTGVCAVYSFDPATRGVVLRTAKPVSIGFGG